MRKEKYKWFHIKAYDPKVGKKISFYLGAKDENQLSERLDKKQIKDIEWIIEEGPFDNK